MKAARPTAQCIVCALKPFAAMGTRPPTEETSLMLLLHFLPLIRIVQASSGYIDLAKSFSQDDTVIFGLIDREPRRAKDKLGQGHFHGGDPTTVL